MTGFEIGAENRKEISSMYVGIFFSDFLSSRGFYYYVKTKMFNHAIYIYIYIL